MIQKVHWKILKASRSPGQKRWKSMFLSRHQRAGACRLVTGDTNQMPKRIKATQPQKSIWAKEETQANKNNGKMQARPRKKDPLGYGDY